MISHIINLDNKLTLFLKNLFPQNTLFDFFFSFFSLQGVTIFIWIIIFILAIIFEETKNPGISNRDKKFIVSFIFSLLITGLLVNFILKNIIQRPRPKPISTNSNQLQKITSNPCPTDFSFPSSHAALSFASATVIAYFDKKRKWLYYTTAILISYSRIYLGCHFFFDVFIGAILGYFLSKNLLKHLTSNT